MDNQRFFLWTALAAILIMLWTAWQDEYGPKPVTQPIAETPVDRSVPTAPDTDARLPDQPQPQAQPASKASPLKTGDRIRVLTDLLEVEIDTFGGDIRVARLRTYPVALDKKDVPFELLNDKRDTLFIAQSGLFNKNNKNLPYHKTLYRATQSRYELKDGNDQLEVVLTWQAPDGVRYDKVYTFKRNSYVVDVAYRVANKSGSDWQGYLYGQLQRIPPEQQTGLFSLPTYSGAAIFTQAEKYEKISYDDIKSGPLEDRRTTGGWAAIMQHYFVVSWMASRKQVGDLYSVDLGENRYVIGYKSAAPATVPAGKTETVGMQLYIGPKESDRLERLVEGMILTVDFGWLTFISAPLFWLLNWIETYVGNWGWSIILLTLFLKVVFYPLNNASYKSMANMRRLQPRLMQMKEKYGQDKQRYNQAMMELYKTEKLNPMAGCLPMLVQIPVFIALYWVLLESVEMRHAPFILWIHDLSAPDPYFVLPVLMGLSMFATTWLTPASDPMQRKIFMAMPVVMTVFFLFFPSGLVLYWFVNNVLQFIQQWHITKRIEASSR